jgi:hypothetical protein
MSLLRLLATGKSLVGMPNTNSRYQMRARNVLPKFGSAKNPFAPPPPNVESPGANVNASPAKLETASLFEPAAQKPVSREPAKQAGIKESKTPPRPAAAPAPPAKVEAKQATRPAPVIPSSKPGRLAGWVKKLNPLSLLPPRRGEGGRGRPARKHVQTELTLEKVRVVRNDLSDADFEIVPGRLMGLPSGASPILSHAGSSTGEPGAWSRLTSKFLGAQHAEIR